MSNLDSLLTHANTLNLDYIYLASGIFQYENYFETVVKTVKKYGIDYTDKKSKNKRHLHWLYWSHPVYNRIILHINTHSYMSGCFL